MFHLDWSDSGLDSLADLCVQHRSHWAAINSAIDEVEGKLQNGQLSDSRHVAEGLRRIDGRPIAVYFLIRGEGIIMAPGTARDLIARAKTEVADEALRVDLIELIETVIIYKLPRLNREEIQAMLEIHDIRESRVYQEAREEGKQEGLKEGKQEGLKEGKQEGPKEGLAMAIGKMAARKMSPAEIAAILEVKLELVQQVCDMLGHFDKN